MTLEDRYKKCDAFLRDLRELVWKHVGKNYDKVDPALLMMMQEHTSLFQPWMWPVENRSIKPAKKRNTQRKKK